jgi:hypothetical protein
VRIHRFAYGVAAIALLGFGASTARANSRAGVGTTGPGSPDCSSLALSLNTSGELVPIGTGPDEMNFCEAGVNIGSIEVIGSLGDLADQFSLYSPLLSAPTVDGSGGGLTESQIDALLSSLAWTQTCGADGTGWECTLTAPRESSAEGAILATLTKDGVINDGDCDRDDTILFVPKNCDLFFTTGAIGNLTGPDEGNGSPFNTADALTSQSFGVPEPGTIALLLAGMVGLFAFRRKYAL